MKRLLAIILAVAISCTSFGVFAADSAVAVKSEQEIINVIKLLGIANGDENGNMNLDAKVTRAQFVKMAICASTEKDNATNAHLNVSLFPDVKNTYWGAGYISAAIKKGLITGHLDGTFRPDNTVSLEEAVTVVLKLLGYTNDDFQGPYPQSQMAKYTSLDLDTNISAVQGQALTRRECMQLLYNALCTKTKTGSVYCTTLGYSVNSDGVIDYNSLIENKIKGPVIVNGDNYKSLIGFDINKATVYRNGKLSTTSAITDYDCFYYINEISTVWTYTDKVFGIVNSVDNYLNPKSVTVSGTTYSVSSDFSDAPMLNTDAYVMLVLDRSSSVCKAYAADSDMYEKYRDPDSDYSDMITATVTDPIVVTDVNSWKQQIPFTVDESTSISLDGKYITQEQIKENDVIYYSQALKSIIVYRKTATGIVKSINTQNNSPVSVTFSNGLSYQLSTNSVKDKFSVTGKYSSENAFVTLLLGLNDGCVEAIDGDTDKLSDNSNNATYIEMVNASISKPILISDRNDLTSWKNKVPFDIDENLVFLNGASSSSSAVRYNDVIYYSAPFKSVWIFRDTASGVISTVSSSSINVAGKNYVLATDSAKYKVSTYGEYSENDYVTLVLGKDSEVVDIYSANTSDIGNKDNDSSYSEVVSSTLKGPYIVTATGNLSSLPFDIANATIYKGSSEISKGDIKPYDVYYYSELLDTVWIYRDTVTGTLEEVKPVISPTSVVVAGKTYSIEASQASYDLSSLGKFHVGDDITLLLGKDGVAGVTSPETVSGVLYGIVTDIGTKTFYRSNGSSYSADYVTVTATSNTAYTYEYDNRYLPVGTVVRVTYSDSVKISELSTSGISSGTAADLKVAFLNGEFSKDCEIIDVYNSKTIKIYPSRLKGIDLDISEFTFGSGIVLYHSYDSDGNLDKLILNNFTGDIYDYGVAYASNGTSVKYMTDSNEITLQTESSISDGPICIKDNSTITTLRPYIDVDVLSKTAAYDKDGNEYKLSNDVKVFIQNASSYTYSELDDVIVGKYNFKAYYDKTPSRGGRVRVIIATRAV